MMWGAAILLILFGHQTPESRLEALEVRVQKNPNSAVARYDLAEMAWRSGQVERAKSLVLDLHSLPYRPVDVFWLEAHLHEEKGSLAEAEEAFRQYLAQDGPRRDAASGLARVLYAQGRLAEAGVAYQEAARRSGNPDDYLNAARVALEQGDALLADQRLREGISVLGPAIALREARVEALSMSGETAAALRELEALLGLAPKHIRWQGLQERLLLELKEREP
jgi:tetratricopeptide (TPR) repeat protein